MSLNAIISEYADYCPICGEMAVLCWGDNDLNETVCDDCAGCLSRAERALGASELAPPSPNLISLNP